MSRDETIERLRTGNPSIAVMGGGENGITITVWMLKPGQEKVVAKRLHQVLAEASV
jgi:L-seryl-tRNA(Ser) seleniumtransferase